MTRKTIRLDVCVWSNFVEVISDLQQLLYINQEVPRSSRAPLKVDHFHCVCSSMSGSSTVQMHSWVSQTSRAAKTFKAESSLEILPSHSVLSERELFVLAKRCDTLVSTSCIKRIFIKCLVCLSLWESSLFCSVGGMSGMSPYGCSTVMEPDDWTGDLHFRRKEFAEQKRSQNGWLPFCSCSHRLKLNTGSLRLCAQGRVW